MLMNIPLTEIQKEMLEDYFEAVRDANFNGDKAAIVAQVFPDGFVVKVLKNDKAEALANALGGNINSVHFSAADRLSH